MRPRSEAEFAASSYGAAGVREILASHDLDAYADTLIAEGCAAMCCPHTAASSPGGCAMVNTHCYQHIVLYNDQTECEMASIPMCDGWVMTRLTMGAV